MMIFSELFLEVCIYGALGLTTLAVLVLIGLFIRDIKNNEVW